MKENDKKKWREYICSLQEKYKIIPTEVCYQIIQKYFIRMYGKRFTSENMKYMYRESDDFIISLENSLSFLSDTVKINIIRRMDLLKSENNNWINLILSK